MSINRAMAKMLADSNGKAKIVHSKFKGINPCLEWLKWLTYESDYEKELMSSISLKPIFQISYAQLEQIYRIKKNIFFADLFKKYSLGNCTKEEYMMVYDYMQAVSIETLMKSKLTAEELNIAKEKISQMNMLPNEEISKLIEEQQKEENYNNLSMIDSYVLHVISNHNYIKNINKLDKELKAQINTNEAVRQRSLYYANNPYLKK